MKIKDIKSLVDLIKNELDSVFKEDAVPGVKAIILDNYSNRLIGLVPKGQMARPEDYFEEFEERLNNFEFTKDAVARVKFIIPDIEKFDFSGDLKFLKHIIEGMVGYYFIISREDYEALGYTPPNFRDNFYLVREDDPLMDDILNTFGADYLEPYAFSNSAPIDLFDGVENYAKNNIKAWSMKAIKQAKSKFESYYNKGVR